MTNRINNLSILFAQLTADYKIHDLNVQSLYFRVIRKVWRLSAKLIFKLALIFSFFITKIQLDTFAVHLNA